MAFDGVLVIDKPRGVVSMRVVEKVRRAARTKRAGHAGTLDPAATGVLPVCLGRSTRIASLIHGIDKEYVAKVRLGVVTSTGDLDGEVVATSAPPATLDVATLADPLAALTGTIEQRPPAYSAIRVDGERLYARARRGEEVEAPLRTVEVYEIEVLAIDAPEVELRVRCGTGTYLRSLAMDLGEALGCGGVLAELRRTRVGALGLDRALTLDEVFERARSGDLGEALVSPSDALAHLPLAVVTEEGLRRLGFGQALPVDEEILRAGVEVDLDADLVRLVDAEGRLVALAEPKDGKLQPRKVFL